MARVTTSPAGSELREGQLRFGMLNWILLAAALVAIVVGYFTLAAGSTVLAPLLLVAGYVVLMPLGIIL